MNISVLLPFWANYSATSAPIYGMSWLPEELRKTSGRSASKWNYEQIVKLCQNRGQIFGKLNFCFLCENCIPRPVSKNLHYILNFGINPNKNLIIKILLYEFIFTMIAGRTKKFTLFGRKFYFSCLIFSSIITREMLEYRLLPNSSISFSFVIVGVELKNI